MSQRATARILVVEDDQTIALGLRMLLNHWGHEVTGVARSGEQALVLAEVEPPDLVLMDVRLDGRMDGIETAAALRYKREMPVLFLTAQSDVATVGRMAATGPTLFKPVEPERLRQVVTDLLGKVASAPTVTATATL